MTIQLTSSSRSVALERLTGRTQHEVAVPAERVEGAFPRWLSTSARTARPADRYDPVAVVTNLSDKALEGWDQRFESISAGSSSMAQRELKFWCAVGRLDPRQIPWEGSAGAAGQLKSLEGQIEAECGRPFPSERRLLELRSARLEALAKLPDNRSVTVEPVAICRYPEKLPFPYRYDRRTAYEWLAGHSECVPEFRAGQVGTWHRLFRDHVDRSGAGAVGDAFATLRPTTSREVKTIVRAVEAVQTSLGLSSPLAELAEAANAQRGRYSPDLHGVRMWWLKETSELFYVTSLFAGLLGLPGAFMSGGLLHPIVGVAVAGVAACAPLVAAWVDSAPYRRGFSLARLLTRPKEVATGAETPLEVATEVSRTPSATVAGKILQLNKDLPKLTGPLHEALEEYLNTATALIVRIARDSESDLLPMLARALDITQRMIGEVSKCESAADLLPSAATLTGPALKAINAGTEALKGHCRTLDDALASSIRSDAEALQAILGVGAIAVAKGRNSHRAERSAEPSEGASSGAHRASGATKEKVKGQSRRRKPQS